MLARTLNLRVLHSSYCYPFTGARPFLHALLGFMPILEWLPKYKFKRDLMSDIIGGLTTGIMHVPQGDFPFSFFLSWHLPIYTAVASWLVHTILRLAGPFSIIQDPGNVLPKFTFHRYCSGIPGQMDLSKKVTDVKIIRCTRHSLGWCLSPYLHRWGSRPRRQ